jgi:hypothetical protein
MPRVAPTRYRVIRCDGVLGIEAAAERSMALLARPVEVDLERTPVLALAGRRAAAQGRHGRQDGQRLCRPRVRVVRLAAVRIGWVLRGKLALTRAIWDDAVPDAALNYVWDNRYPVVARHDVRQDSMAEFGTPQVRLIQLAAAPDTDNTGERARRVCRFPLCGKRCQLFRGVGRQAAVRNRSPAATVSIPAGAAGYEREQT